LQGKYNHLNRRFIFFPSLYDLAQCRPVQPIRRCGARSALLSAALRSRTNATSISSTITATTHSPPLSHTQTHLYIHCNPLASCYRHCNHSQILFFTTDQALPTIASSPADRRRLQHTASAC
jgi:hypothetical protein